MKFSLFSGATGVGLYGVGSVLAAKATACAGAVNAVGTATSWMICGVSATAFGTGLACFGGFLAIGAVIYAGLSLAGCFD